MILSLDIGSGALVVSIVGVESFVVREEDCVGKQRVVVHRTTAPAGGGGHLLTSILISQQTSAKTPQLFVTSEDSVCLTALSLSLQLQFIHITLLVNRIPYSLFLFLGAVFKSHNTIVVYEGR